MTNSYGEVLLMADEDRLNRLLQQLVDMIGLYNGQVSLVVHEGAVRKVEVSANYRLIFDSGSQFDVRTIRLAPSVQHFVQSEMQAPMLERIGRHGYLTVDAKDGNVTRAGYHRRWKPPQR